MCKAGPTPWTLAQHCAAFVSETHNQKTPKGSPKLGIMLAQRRRRWANIIPTLCHRPNIQSANTFSVGIILGQRRRRWANIRWTSRVLCAAVWHTDNHTAASTVSWHRNITHHWSNEGRTCTTLARHWTSVCLPFSVCLEVACLVTPPRLLDV